MQSITNPYAFERNTYTKNTTEITTKEAAAIGERKENNANACHGKQNNAAASFVVTDLPKKHPSTNPAQEGSSQTKAGSSQKEAAAVTDSTTQSPEKRPLAKPGPKSFSKQDPPSSSTPGSGGGGGR